MDAEQARLQLEAAAASLAAGEVDFATLAKELSQDPATRHDGGELGWVTRGRLAEDFAKAVWELPLNQATLIETTIGWHLVEVLGRQDRQERSFEEAKQEVITAMRSVKRREAIKKYRTTLREWEKHRVTIYHEMMK